MDEPLKIMILGSCVSRDVVRVAEDAPLDLSCYIARTSFGSGFLEKPLPRGLVDLDKLTSPFQRRMVEFDVLKKLPGQLRAREFDLLVVDLIDERFMLLETDDKRLCTASRELLSTGVDPKKDFARSIVPGTDLHFDYWVRGWERFLEIMRELGRVEDIRVNEVYWAHDTVDGTSMKPEEVTMVGGANAYLERLHDHIRKTLPASQIISFPRESFLADPNHKWGLTPFHFSDSYYHEAARRIVASR